MWQGPPDSRDGRKTIGGHDSADSGALRFADTLALENDKGDGSRSEERMRVLHSRLPTMDTRPRLINIIFISKILTCIGTYTYLLDIHSLTPCNQCILMWKSATGVKKNASWQKKSHTLARRVLKTAWTQQGRKTSGLFNFVIRSKLAYLEVKANGKFMQFTIVYHYSRCKNWANCV